MFVCVHMCMRAMYVVHTAIATQSSYVLLNVLHAYVYTVQKTLPCYQLYPLCEQLLVSTICSNSTSNYTGLCTLT